MIRKILNKVILSAILLTNLVACNAESPAPKSTETPQVNQNSNLCANPLYPVVQGATWSYSSTGSAGLVEPYTFTDTITEVRADRFTLTSQFPELTRTQEWACKPEGLVALQFGSGPAGGLSTSQLKMEVTTSNITGVTFPVTVTAGQTWPYALDFTGSLEVAGTPAEGQGSLSSTFNAVGTESVTVPAGTIEAMKVLVTTTMDVQATFSGLTVPVTFTATSAVWFAPNVGWVKMENAGDFQGTQFTETISLISYNIP